MKKLLLIILLIVGCDKYALTEHTHEDTESQVSNICAYSLSGHHQTEGMLATQHCFDWTDSENACILDGHTFVSNKTCAEYCIEVGAICYDCDREIMYIPAAGDVEPSVESSQNCN